MSCIHPRRYAQYGLGPNGPDALQSAAFAALETPEPDATPDDAPAALLTAAPLTPAPLTDLPPDAPTAPAFSQQTAREAAQALGAALGRRMAQATGAALRP